MKIKIIHQYDRNTFCGFLLFPSENIDWKILSSSLLKFRHDDVSNLSFHVFDQAIGEATEKKNSFERLKPPIDSFLLTYNDNNTVRTDGLDLRSLHTTSFM